MENRPAPDGTDPGTEASGIRRLQNITQAEDLCSLSLDTLMALFRASPAPESVRRLDGHPAGVGVAPIILSGGRIERWLRRYAQSERFIWHGKSFASLSDDDGCGWGYNRLAVGPVLDAFPFRTFLGPSRIDGRPSLILDFDVPRNPWWERRTWDELREVGPGVFGGTTGLRLFNRYRPLAWFACDTNRQVTLEGTVTAPVGPIRREERG
jgi:hypothetical protein